MVNYISVHVPKCAGSGLKRAIRKSYTPDQVFEDYAGGLIDPAAEMNIDPVGFFQRENARSHPELDGKVVIHGHFNPRKYNFLENTVKVTMIREPIARAISHYFYWQSVPDNHHPVCRLLIEKKLTIREFVRLPVIRQFYTRHVFLGVDLATFDFIGISENSETDFPELCRRINVTPPETLANANKAEGYDEKKDEILSDPVRLGRLKDLLADEIKFYEAAASLFH